MLRRLPVVLVLVLAILLGPGFTLAQDDPLQATTRTVNVELIIDASGSMAEVLPGSTETRMQAAKRILRQVIDDLPQREGVNVGLRVYGHKGDNTAAGRDVSCRSSELLVPVSGLYKDVLLQQVDAIQPTGWTPIAYSLQQAAADFQPGGESITNAIVLVTDGEETCDPPEQACAASEALHQAGVQVTTHVVGFALTPEQTELVRCVAEEGGGQLFGADNAEELGVALTTALQEVGAGATPTAQPPPALPAPTALSGIRTLAYHQLTQWTTAVDENGEQAPLLSDNGQIIAFARSPGSQDPANPNRIFVMSADGTDEREVDAYQTLCFCGSVIDLSADGSRVVSSDAVQVRVAETSGGGGRELVALSSNEIDGVRISGDGRVVVFRVGRDTTTRAGQAIERGIYIANADGTGVRQIVGPSQMGPLLGVTPENVPVFQSIWGLDISHDGSRVVFATYSDEIDPTSGNWREGLFAVNSDGSGLHQLLGPNVTYVLNGAISGDGQIVAYVTRDFATGYDEAGVIAFDGGGQRKLSDNTIFHPGTGRNLPSSERIQLNSDGSRLLLGSSGLLYDTAGSGLLALGLDIPPVSGQAALATEGLYLATMDATVARVVYLFQPVTGPRQLARLDLNPTDLLGAPAISEPRVAPSFVLTESRSTTTISARVAPIEPAPWVGSRILRGGMPDDEGFGRIVLYDDGTTGDAMSRDGVYSNNAVATNCCAAPGPRTIRVQAEHVLADGLQHASAVDIAPFAVVTSAEEAPAATEPGTPVTGEGPEAATISPVPAEGPGATTEPATPPVTTGPGTETPAPPASPAAPSDPAQATIAAQATLIAELQPPTPTPTPPLDPAQATIAAQATLIAELGGGNPPTPSVPPAPEEAPVSPAPPDTDPAPATGPGTGDATSTAADFITPDPAECTVTPRTADELAALNAAPDQAAIDALVAAWNDAILTIPDGLPADAATTAAVVETYRLIIACNNAGNQLAGYALWTDDALRQVQAEPPAGAPTPVPAEGRAAFRVSEVRMLPNGQVAAVWQYRDPLLSGSWVQILVRQDGRYHVDETLDLLFE